jgi:hypothetical protein
MGNWANEQDTSPARNASARSLCRFIKVITIGATGAVGAIDTEKVYGGITRTSAGLYALTFPKGRNAFIQAYIIAAGTPVVLPMAYPQSVNAGAGTANILFTNASFAATDPANGDKIQLIIEVERS